ncbi:carbohydrate-binding family V/XII [Halieaceae bacterium IMCC14734]|uniref:Carbohydrate-binding family V/XII n=1 Tax=Candidatus Litorirhabdus singularis TaxID=2518993 RepID=A0ABT3TBC3_9GAMM|nr:carbohydrate-binding family V/XII [Candidatus Litorirhabdus singularis]MCX2979578.1 carbohydrate-binding family V/XII [Candidatus Litorirhabdus singularis]
MRLFDSKHYAPLAALVVLALLSVSAQALEWPQEVSIKDGVIVIYQPQPESLQGNVLKSRAAISIEVEEVDHPIFGVMWFDARVDTDRGAGTALVRDIKVTKVGWPESTDAQEQRFTAVVEAAMPEAGLSFSLERLTASLSTAEVEQRSLEQLKTDPPVIIFSDELALLLMFDGKPHFSAIEGSSYERALNTPFLVVRDKKKGQSWMGSGAQWFSSSDPLGPWQPNAKPPADLLQMMPEDTAEAGESIKVDKVVVATEATELIATNGKAEWTALSGGALLYVSNTETPWLRELETGNMYVLLSGRWYRSKSQKGPWTFVRADELPVSFSDIPPASDIGGLRTSVAGTEEAEQAMLDAAIPQTTAIKRDEASLTVSYDGEPKFEKIKGTEVSYAVNTGSQVLAINGRYYAVDEGVWFTATMAKGPWVVADTIPDDEIGKIPPSSPVYNTTYVKVYESTPEIVYVGYTPGYMWSYPYYGVPVYGTGWYYPPYYGAYYYPRPPTWGLHVGYNPWTGWNFGVTWSNGFLTLGMSFGGGWNSPYHRGGWYGGGYRRPVVINTGDINIGNSVNIGNRDRVNRELGDRGNAQRPNIYNREGNRARNADNALARSELKRARPAPTRANDVFADRSGNVARRNGSEWEQRSNGQWQSDKANVARDKAANVSTQQAAKVQSRAQQMPDHNRQQINRNELNRSYDARQRGTRHEMNRSGMRQGRRR